MVISHPEKCGVNVDLPGIPVKLAAPARRALKEAGLTSLEKLSAKTEQEVLALHGMGRNAMANLKRAMQAQGLDFKNSG